jgi:hypothetical protein
LDSLRRVDRLAALGLGAFGIPDRVIRLGGSTVAAVEGLRAGDRRRDAAPERLR